MYSGSQVLLYLKTQDKWHIVGGMRNTKLILNSQLINVGINGESPWKELLPEAGLRQLTIIGSGAFSNSSAENDIQKLAFSGKIAEYKLIFPAGNSVGGKFQINNYQRIANMDEEERYTISLVSSGQIFFLG